jgi:hypothetical protein
MRGPRQLGRSIGLVLATLLGLVGCHSNYNSLRPPKPPEDYTPPPKEDLRFSLPVEYPKNSLNSDNLIRPKDVSPMGPGGPGGMGGPGGANLSGSRGMGGMGGGGMGAGGR